MPPVADTPRIFIERRARRLRIRSPDGKELEYRTVLGKNAREDKQVEGDHATPLGEFFVCAKNPLSRFFLSLCLSYPNREHAARGLASHLIDEREHEQILDALSAGRMPPQHTRLGGEIYIHGFGTDSALAAGRDWTQGCIAIDNQDMRVVFDLAQIGTPVHIVD
jgi:murein L,D-transpeptidase YafK